MNIPKYNIVFVHSAIAQFKQLHLYLHENNIANSYVLCSQATYNAEHEKIPNLRVFSSVEQKSKNLFFYLTKIDENVRKSFGVKNSITSLLEEVKIDLIVCHHSGGTPMQLYDEFDIPIITYIEFPSFKHHGWDTKYPPPEANRYRDKLYEMNAYYDVIMSNKVIVPSLYAKKMFPQELQNKISVQMEGFKIKDTDSQVAFEKQEGITYIGFTARDLSSAKGFEQFIVITKKILQERTNVKFIMIGSSTVLYSYEGVFLKKKYGDESQKTFKDYIFERENLDASYYEYYDFLKYDTYNAYINTIDFFLYPLQFGSANWGIYEIYCRGKIIIASNKCYIPELITDKIDGFLCEYEEISSWVSTAVELIDNLKNYNYMKTNIKINSQKYMIENISKNYLELFHEVISKHNLNPN